MNKAEEFLRYWANGLDAKDAFDMRQDLEELIQALRDEERKEVWFNVYPYLDKYLPNVMGVLETAEELIRYPKTET